MQYIFLTPPSTKKKTNSSPHLIKTKKFTYLLHLFLYFQTVLKTNSNPMIKVYLFTALTLLFVLLLVCACIIAMKTGDSSLAVCSPEGLDPPTPPSICVLPAHIAINFFLHTDYKQLFFLILHQAFYFDHQCFRKSNPKVKWKHGL